MDVRSRWCFRAVDELAFLGMMCSLILVDFLAFEQRVIWCWMIFCEAAEVINHLIEQMRSGSRSLAHIHAHIGPPLFLTSPSSPHSPSLPVESSWFDQAVFAHILDITPQKIFIFVQYAHISMLPYDHIRSHFTTSNKPLNTSNGSSYIHRWLMLGSDLCQLTGEADEPWIHALLLAVAKHTGLAALINTSILAKLTSRSLF